MLVSQPHDAERASDHEWDADTDSIPGASDVEVGDAVEPTAEEIPVVIEPRVWAVGGAFANLDVVNISEVFDRRPKLRSREETTSSQRRVEPGSPASRTCRTIWWNRWSF